MSIPFNQPLEIPDLPVGDGASFHGRIGKIVGDGVFFAHQCAGIDFDPGDGRRRRHVLTWHDGESICVCSIQILDAADGRLECRVAPDERRAALRVRCDMSLQFTPVPVAALHDVAESILARLERVAAGARELEGGIRLDGGDEALRAEAGSIRRLLERITLQLDRQLAAVEDRPSAPDAVTELAGEAVDISASGIAFRHSHPLVPRAYLRLQIDLHGFAGGIQAVGVVKRCVPLSENAHPDGKFDIGVFFTHLRPADRELILRHVLNLRRELAREGRGG